MAYLSFYAVPQGEMVSKGIYRVSRNPFYFFTCLAYLGVGIASLSWLLILLTLVFSVLQHQVVLAEERICEVNFGKKYLEYRQKTPRYFLFF
jgi:protein-S-isoprenylcysteine O-methyltransferase Ste14